MANPSHQESGSSTSAGAEEQATETSNFPALVHHPDISATWRYGLVLWLSATLALLLASDIGSGVQALTETVPDESLGIEFEVQVLLDASVFTSVAELWKAGSKPLAVFVVITSITWPYIKLLLTLYAWITPVANAKRRERLITALDVLGKWSFADVIVFTVIVVVFRETIPLGGAAGVLEVWIRPQWGLYGFISASMLSLMATHAVLYHHRRVMYTALSSTTTTTTLDQQQSSLPSVASQLSTGTRILWFFLFLVSFAAYLTGVVFDFFRVTNVQGGIERGSDDYSVARIGRDLPDAKRDYEPAGGLIYLQIVWFLLGVAMPLLFVVILGVVCFWSFSVSKLRQWLLVAEIALSWSCSDVVLISTVLAIREIPTFGDGLIDTGCSQCYVVTTSFHAEVAVLAIGTAATYLSAALVLPKVHHTAYQDKSLPPPAASENNNLSADANVPRKEDDGPAPSS